MKMVFNEKAIVRIISANVELSMVMESFPGRIRYAQERLLLSIVIENLVAYLKTVDRR